MTEEKLQKIYRKIRIAIFLIPALVVAIGVYLVLFPIDEYKYFPDDPKLSKFEVARDRGANRLSFGVFPLRDYRYIELTMKFDEIESAKCRNQNPEVTLAKTYQAYLYPTGDVISTPERLREILFEGNRSKFPNGSLLHLKPTNEVFLISRGKKILFPGPEILTAFGYSFDDLTEVEQSDIDLFPNADQRVFLWTMPHPDGAIFQSFPSHSLSIVSEGKKYPIESKGLLDEVWPENFAIPVSDFSPEDNLQCSGNDGAEKIACRFDGMNLAGIGGYYFFTVGFPESCPVENMQPENSRIRFFSEKSVATAKESLRNIAISVLNRYLYQP